MQQSGPSSISVQDVGEGVADCVGNAGNEEAVAVQGGNIGACNLATP